MCIRDSEDGEETGEDVALDDTWNYTEDGVELMDKLHEKYDRFTAAVARLREALDDYKKFPLDSVRDGTIQRFEFCTELAWKTMRDVF